MENTPSNDNLKTSTVVKSTNEELMQVTYVVMVPDEVDLHGDVTTAAEVRKACHSFNKFCSQPNLYHREDTGKFEIAESYLTPVDFTLENREIKKGTWLVNLQIKDNDLWSKIKDRNICSVSIGAVARCEELSN